MQNIAEIFRNLFKLLSRSTQAIYRYLHWMAKNYRTVFPSREHIAAAVGCSIRTVARALQLFETNGWLVVKKRAYQSNVYFMDESLIALDLDDPKTFMRDPEKPGNVPEDGTQNVPVFNVVSSNKNTYYQNAKKVVFGFLPDFLKIQGLGEQTRRWLYKNFSECVLHEALENARWYLSQGNKIENFEAYVTKMAKFYKAKQN